MSARDVAVSALAFLVVMAALVALLLVGQAVCDCLGWDANAGVLP